jgi:hypothetical protein
MRLTAGLGVSIKGGFMDNVSQNVDCNKKGIQDLVEGVDFVYVPGWKGRRLKKDVKDFDPKYADILYKAFMEAENELVCWDFPNFDVPKLQKKILKERYGIDYRTFHELNPDVSFLC